MKKSKYKAKGGIVSKQKGKQIGGGMIGFKKTSKYKAKGGVVSKQKGKQIGSGMKMSKYRAKGGIVKKMGGGRTKYNIKYTIKPRYIMYCIN